jgi:hypothetical protein
MRKLFESGISIIVALSSLGLCVKWYLKGQEIEPLIGIVASTGVLLTAAVYRIFPEKKEEVNPTIRVENSKNVVVGSTIKAGGRVQIGDQTTTINNEGATIKNQFNGGTFNNTTFE